MSETQLREAFTLMKQGNKVGAARLVEAVLREDRSNSNAWWLYSHLLEDEEKVVKSLERVLALSPEHAGARKRLAQMRPEYAHLAANPVAEKEKAKADTAYWKKLDEGSKIKSSEVAASFGQMIWSSLGIRFKIFLVLLPFMIGYMIFFNWRNQQSFYDKNGDTPLTIGAIYLEALYREDFETIYAIACPEYYPEVEQMQREGSGINPSNVSVDLSETSFGMYYQNGDQAYVSVRGITHVDYGDGQTLTVDWADDAETEDIDVYGEHFYRTDEVWQVCVEREVPNLRQVED